MYEVQRTVTLYSNKKIKQMKNLLFITATIILTQICSAQNDSIDYFGQTPPGDSAIVFAPGIISLANRYNQNGVFSPDGKEFCFTVTNSGWTKCDMYYSQIENDEWLTPQLANFITGVIWDPIFTPDGNNIVYSYSEDLWSLEHENDTWGNPLKIDSPVNSSSPEFSPSVALNGTIYFFSRRTMDIYFADKEDGLYKEVNKVMSPINDFDDREPFIAAYGSYLLFTSFNRTDQLGQGDLYISYWTNNRWTNPKNLGAKINSSFVEYSPNVTPDGRYLLFSRRYNSSSDIFWVSTSFIDSLRATNYRPYVLNPIPDKTDTAGNHIKFIIPDSTFFDDDNDPLTISASLKDDSDLPESLTFDPQTKTLSGLFAEAGKFNIKITATDTEGASVSNVFNLTIEQATTIVDLKSTVIIYPNPATQTIQIKGIDIFSNKANYQLTDLNGKTIMQGRMDSETIDISGFPKGIYLLSLDTGKEIIFEKIMIE